MLGRPGVEISSDDRSSVHLWLGPLPAPVGLSRRALAFQGLPTACLYRTADGVRTCDCASNLALHLFMPPFFGGHHATSVVFTMLPMKGIPRGAPQPAAARVDASGHLHRRAPADGRPIVETMPPNQVDDEQKETIKQQNGHRYSTSTWVAYSLHPPFWAPPARAI